MGRDIRRFVVLCAAGALALTGSALGAGATVASSAPDVVSWQSGAVLHGTPEMSGFSFATAVSADGHLALVGSDGQHARGATIFSDSGRHWQRVATLTAVGGSDRDGFGMSVALTPDGATALVGAPGAHHGRGAAYVFRDIGGTWRQTAELAGSSVSAGDAFGTSLGITADATMAVVGSQPNPDGTSVPVGAVYVFLDTGGSWTEAQQIDPPMRGRNAFGRALAVSADGKVLMVGAPGDITDRRPYVALYGLGRDSRWAYQSSLSCPCSDNRPQFGAALALSSDGQVALVGAPDTGGACFSGWVMAYRAGSLFERFVPGGCGVAYGTAVALSADGTVGLVGGPEPYGGFPGSGQARVIDGIGSGHATTQKLAPQGLEQGDRFGGAVALSAAGDSALVGASLHAGSGRNRGSAFVFTRSAAGVPVIPGAEPTTPPR